MLCVPPRASPCRRRASGAPDAPRRRWPRCAGHAQGDWTALHAAAEIGPGSAYAAAAVGICTALCERGADVNARDSVRGLARQPHRRHSPRCVMRAQKAKTPLHHAAKEGNVAICTLLCKRGADVNATDIVRATARQPVPHLLRDQADARPRAAPAPPRRTARRPWTWQGTARTRSLRCALRPRPRLQGVRAV